MKIVNVSFNGFRGLIEGLFKHKQQLGTWFHSRELSIYNLNIDVIIGGETVKVNHGSDLFGLLIEAVKSDKLTPEEAENIAQQLDRVSVKYNNIRTLYHVELLIEDDIVEEKPIEVLTEEPVGDIVVEEVETTVKTEAPKRGRKASK